LERAIASGVPHVSVYLFEVDEESRLGREMLEKGIRYGATAVPGEDEMADFYQRACVGLDAEGVEQYEISNFAREGHRSRHNLKYWQRQPYIGFGLDAHSMLRAGEDAVRFANTSDLDQYLSGAADDTPFRLLGDALDPGAELDLIGRDAAFEETLFLGLRLNEGVDFDGLRLKFGEAMLREAMPALHEVRDAGLLELTSNTMRLTPHGRLLSNEVFSRLLIASPA
jgi:oxygen-independent coproporphyrinogen-3 oxidase